MTGHRRRASRHTVAGSIGVAMGTAAVYPHLGIRNFCSEEKQAIQSRSLRSGTVLQLW